MAGEETARRLQEALWNTSLFVGLFVLCWVSPEPSTCWSRARLSWSSELGWESLKQARYTLAFKATL